VLNIDLKGKVAIVTGGAKGIGAGIAAVLSEAGAKVYCADIFAGQSKNEEGLADINAVDVTNAEQLQNLADKIEKKHGSIDIMVTSAGTTTVSPIEKLSHDEWQRIININLTGSFNAVKAVVPAMLRKGAGVIVMIGSAAIIAGGGGGVHYAASKSGLEGLNRALTKELAPRGIRTNLIHPSLIDTELLRQRHPDPEVRSKIAKEVPLGRLGKTEDIAYLTAFLASDLSGYIAGQSFFVDGGRTFCK
jgi:3-oxoacyl-[acyl-carrier protein] reductase